jgi:hypothetical protein
MALFSRRHDVPPAETPRLNRGSGRRGLADGDGERGAGGGGRPGSSWPTRTPNRRAGSAPLLRRRGACGRPAPRRTWWCRGRWWPARCAGGRAAPRRERHGGNQWVVAEGVGGAGGGALLWVAVHLADGGAQVDGHRPIAGSGAGRPGPLECLLGEAVELAEVPEGEGAPEGPPGGGGPDPVAEHLAGGAAAQQVGVVAAVPPASIAWTRGNSLRPGRSGPARSPGSIS